MNNDAAQSSADLEINQELLNDFNINQEPDIHLSDQNQRTITNVNISPLSSTIEEIHRATNDEILNIFRRLVILRERTNQLGRLRDDYLDIEENLFDLLTSNKLFIFSPFILILLISFLGIQIGTIYEKDLIKDLSLKTLEKPILWLPYIYTYLICLVLLWNLYLMFFKIVTNFLYQMKIQVKKKTLFECSTADMLYFNPLYFNILIIYYDRTYLSTNFDLFIIMLISTHYFIIFLFSNYIYNFYKIKITNITNLYLNENKILIYKYRVLFLFLIFMNLLTSYSITYLTTEANFSFIYIIQHKSIYLLLKQINMIYENETNYKQLDNYYSTNEHYYLNTTYIKMLLQLFMMILIVQIFMFGNGLFLKKSAYIFFVPGSIVNYMTLYDFIKILKNYEEIKKFFDQLESV